MELKNVHQLSPEHVNQISRYLAHDFGQWGVLVTRTAAPRAVVRNIIDLWSAQRKTIVVLTDQDLEQIAELYDSKARSPLDVLLAAHARHVRLRPS